MDCAEVRPRGATPRPRSGVAAKRNNLTSKELQLGGCSRAERTYSTFNVRRDDLVQGKKDWLHFAGAAMRRYPMIKVTETQRRWQVLRDGIRGQTH